MILGSKSNIRAWYKFDGNANDSSGNAYNGTVTGATLTTDKWGNTNSAYQFTGASTDEISFPTSMGFFGTSDFSIELFYQITDLTVPASEMIINIFNSATEVLRFGVSAGGSAIFMKIMNNFVSGGAGANADTNWKVYYIVGGTSNVARGENAGNYIESNETDFSSTITSFKLGWESNSPDRKSADMKVAEFKLSNYKKSKLQQLWNYRTHNYRKAI